MDVKLQDGTIVTNVPDGITQSELMARMGRAKDVTPAPVAQPAPPQKPLTNDSPGVIDKFILDKFGDTLAKAPDIQSATVDVPNPTGAGTIPISPGRIIQGAAELPMGVTQMIGRMVGAPDKVKDIRQRTEQLRGEDAGTFDWQRLGGAMLNPLPYKAAGMLPTATTLGARTAQGAAMGAGIGATTPVTDGKDEDFWKNKSIQSIVSALVGGAIPGAADVVKAGGRAVRDTLDLVLPGGATRISDRYTEKIAGPESIGKVVQAAKDAKELVPGSNPTMAQAVAGLPEGSPIQAHQKIVAATPGGPSAQFGQRSLDQKAARVAAAEARDATTGPMRESALEAANVGGVKADKAVEGIDKMLNTPGQRASDVVQKTLNSVKEKIASLTDESGVINANDLYTIRKELGNTIQTHAKETANWDKKLASGLQRDIQKSFDDAIESAGGTGWKDYLQKYSTASQAIRADLDRAKLALKPEQKTALAGGVNVAEETRTHLPNLLSRPAMIANAVLRYAGAGVEPRVDKIMAGRYLDPAKFAEAMDKIPFPQRKAIVDAIVQQGGRTAAMGTAEQY